MIQIDFLMTTVGLDKNSILYLVERNNLFGNVIVGNQKWTDDYVEKLEHKDVHITIVNQKSVGTSKNRNVLLKYATSEFVTFWDDDCILDRNFCKFLKKINSLNNLNAFRVNVISANKNRPIKIIKKTGDYSFFTLRSFGVCGIFFKLQSITDANLLFDEHIGPGTTINHGEDTLFLKMFLTKFRKIHQFCEILITALQDKSCWFESNVEEYYVSQGYLYSCLFGFNFFFFGLYNIIRHRNDYKCSIIKKIKYFLKGHTHYKSSKIS